MTLKIYTDGSYRDKTIAWAFVVVKKRTVIHTENGIIKNPGLDLLKINSTAAEMSAVMLGVCWAMSAKYKRILICHDDYHVSDCFRGVWRLRNNYIQQYIRWMQLTNIYIKFRYVKGHSGDTFNDLAHDLARVALNYSDSNI